MENCSYQAVRNTRDLTGEGQLQSSCSGISRSIDCGARSFTSRIAIAASPVSVLVSEQRRHDPKASDTSGWLDFEAHERPLSSRSQRDRGLLGMPIMTSAARMA